MTDDQFDLPKDRTCVNCRKDLAQAHAIMVSIQRHSGRRDTLPVCSRECKRFLETHENVKRVYRRW